MIKKRKYIIQLSVKGLKYPYTKVKSWGIARGCGQRLVFRHYKLSLVAIFCVKKLKIIRVNK